MGEACRAAEPSAKGQGNHLSQAGQARAENAWAAGRARLTPSVISTRYRFSVHGLSFNFLNSCFLTAEIQLEVDDVFEHGQFHIFPCDSQLVVTRFPEGDHCLSNVPPSLLS